jgi:hypothetical protein
MQIDDLKEDVKKCDKDLDKYALELSGIIDAHETDEPRFVPTPPATVPVDTIAAAVDAANVALAAEIFANDGKTVEATPEPEPDAESEPRQQASYRSVLEAAKVEELALAPKITEKLQEAGATTIWALETLRGDISQGRKRWPKGTGKKKVTAIEDAISKWVARNADQWQAGDGPAAVVRQVGVTATEPVPSIEAQQKARDARVTSILAGQPIDQLAERMTAGELEACKSYGCVTLADFEWAVENRKVPALISLGDAARVLAAWKRDHLDRLIEESMDAEQAGEIVGTVVEPTAEQEPTGGVKLAQKTFLEDPAPQVEPQATPAPEPTTPAQSVDDLLLEL